MLIIMVLYVVGVLVAFSLVLVVLIILTVIAAAKRVVSEVARIKSLRILNMNLRRVIFHFN